MIRRFDANHSRCYYTDNNHLYFFKDQPCNRGIQNGITIKHRRKDQNWQHISFRIMRYKSSEKYFGHVRHFELVWHLSKKWKGDRVIGSKRYLRFKACL